MTFTSVTYLVFFVVVFFVYWVLPRKGLQNGWLLAASYLFYGFVHPWFCILLAVSTVTDFICGLGIARGGPRKRLYLIVSLVVNLGMLCGFKYFNFFMENVHAVLSAMGLSPGELTLSIFLPVGISFYTFQTLSYTIDIYRGELKPTKSFIDFACFVSLFPQLVAGPIERARHMLPQLEQRRTWNQDFFFGAWPLMIRGYLKKMVIADNVAVYVDKIFMLEEPGALLLGVGALAFAVQIYADFSAYTDIARASARMLGIELMENFKSPYLAISPSDFWRRWHISFSSWIRDYVYIPLGGSKVETRWQFFKVVLTTMALAGLWHGAAWNFVAWGVFHGLITFVYHQLGLGGRWQPSTRLRLVAAWAVMFTLTVFGWLLFRTPDMAWLMRGIATPAFSREELHVAMRVAVLTLFYISPLFVFMALDRLRPKFGLVHAVAYGFAMMAIVIFHRGASEAFIYFQF